jgi:hypothetical protein
MIHLDFPTIDVSLNKSFWIKGWIGTNRESRFAIQALGSFAKAITDRLDAEIDDSLPNGFHDALLEALEIRTFHTFLNALENPLPEKTIPIPVESR